MGKKEECRACIGFDGEHTCEGWAHFQAMKADKDKCQNCARLQARVEALEGASQVLQKAFAGACDNLMSADSRAAIELLAATEQEDE